MKKSSMRTLALTAILAGTVSIGGIMAYFTDGDTATNTFTVGKISLDLQEPSWVPPTNITPGQEIAKDPQIKNDGNNEEFVFLKVTVPYANVVTANEDGTKGKTADTELFSYDVKDGWTELLAKKEIDSSLKTVTHLYAYTGDTTDSMKALAVNSSTPSLFDWVRFANIVEDQNLETTTQNIVIEAYGIQTQNIKDEKGNLDGDNNDGKTLPLDVWKVIENQNPSLQNTVTEDINTDIKTN